MDDESGHVSAMSRRKGVRTRPQFIRSGTMIGPLSALNAVRIEIIDKYRSTNQVHLPLSFRAAELSLQDFQYDFTLEEEVLKRGEARRRSSAVQEAREMTEASKPPALNGHGPPAHLQAMLMSSEILQPTPSTVPIVTSSSKLPASVHPSMLSLRDFESQNTDPFEMAELKTIDVMAELSSVLQPTTVVSAAIPSALPSEPSTAAAAVSSSASATAEHRNHPSAGAQAVHHHPPTATGASSTNTSTISDGVGLPAANAAVTAAAASVQPPIPTPAQMSPTSPARPVPTPRASKQRTSTNNSSTTSVVQASSGNAVPSRPARPPPPTHTRVASHPVANVSQAGAPPLVRTTASPAVDRPAQPIAAVTANGPVSSSNAIAAGPPPAYSSVRGSLPAATQQTSDNFPPPYPVNLPKEPKPTREAPPPPYTMLASQVVAAAPTGRYSDYELKDVYSKLNRKEKKVVDKLSPMGFPRARLARTVQRIGCDEAKVLEFVILVNKLTESPNNYPADSSETALVNNESNEEKAIQSLKLVFELKEMGFAEAIIHQALKETSNKRDEAVEYIISHA